MRDVVVIANAPVSYGAFELTVGIMPDVPDGATVLDQVADAGYAGVDLGPLGYLHVVFADGEAQKTVQIAIKANKVL